MSLKDKLLSLVGACSTALLMALAWVGPVLAEAGDGDGLDADELILPVVAAVAVAIGAGITYWRMRRPQSAGPRP